MLPTNCYSSVQAATSRAPRAIGLLSAFFVLFGMLSLLAGAGMTTAQESQRRATLLHVDGTITPVMATYIGRGIESAGDRLVICFLDAGYDPEVLAPAQVGVEVRGFERRPDPLPCMM